MCIRDRQQQQQQKATTTKSSSLIILDRSSVVTVSKESVAQFTRPSSGVGRGDEDKQPESFCLMDPAHACVMAAKPHYLSFEIVRSAVSIRPLPLRFIAFIAFFCLGRIQRE